jgi:uncharacterized protein YecE (DUF72 family)
MFSSHSIKFFPLDGEELPFGSFLLSRRGISPILRLAEVVSPEHRIDMAIHIGTSGWAYPSWKPRFYPAKLPAKKFLEHYATRLNSVEVNYTFRQLPSAAMLDGWLASAGEGFKFSFKAPQRITHFARLKNCSDLLESFYAALDPVPRAKRLGVVLFQLPPNFKANVELLDEFLSVAARPGLRLAFEFRNESWFAPEVFRLLKRHTAALCVAESDALESPDVMTSNFRCYRLRKIDYSAAELEKIVARLKEQGGEGDVFVYFKHEEAPTGALHAAEVLRQLNEQRRLDLTHWR